MAKGQQKICEARQPKANKDALSLNTTQPSLKPDGIKGLGHMKNG